MLELQCQVPHLLPGHAQHVDHVWKHSPDYNLCVPVETPGLLAINLETPAYGALKSSEPWPGQSNMMGSHCLHAMCLRAPLPSVGFAAPHVQAKREQHNREGCP